ncbi:YciI family protein [Pseudonocardia thermophila]|uniref:YciI family protein n=1 Tax=Pseudonocardia thermophila TaxID=1848 RepID=UPI00248E2CD0|nr:YciI family protein [Pseudonocardia thermophila]
MLGCDYWLVRSHPCPQTSAEDVATVAGEHVSWLLELEWDGVVVMSGPLVEGPGVRPGSGVAVLCAAEADEAGRIAEQDPFVRPGLRTFELYRWRVNEGSIAVTVELGPVRSTGADERWMHMSTVGVIGLGRMGLPIAVNLVERGFPVVGYRRHPTPEVTEAGVQLAGSRRTQRRGPACSCRSCPASPRCGRSCSG